MGISDVAHAAALSSQCFFKVGLQIVIIGDNRDNYYYASVFKSIAENNKEKVYYSEYSTENEYETYAGSDIFLMPSISESCGTAQMRAMNYGVIPIISNLNCVKDSAMDVCEYMNNGGVLSKGV